MLQYFFPFDSFTLVTNKSPTEVRTALQRRIATRSLLQLFDSVIEPYIGFVGENRFRMKPVLAIRNSFLPVIAGRFEQHGIGTIVYVHRRPIIFVAIFMAFWLFMLSSFLLSVMDSIDFESTLFGFGLLAAASLLMNGGFWWEARHTKETLKFFLDAIEFER